MYFICDWLNDFQTRREFLKSRRTKCKQRGAGGPIGGKLSNLKASYPFWVWSQDAPVKILMYHGI